MNDCEHEELEFVTPAELKYNSYICFRLRCKKCRMVSEPLEMEIDFDFDFEWEGIYFG